MVWVAPRSWKPPPPAGGEALMLEPQLGAFMVLQAIGSW